MTAPDRPLLEALADLLARAERALAAHAPDCSACGACCDFRQAGHRLYVTPAEVSLLRLQPPPQPPRELHCPYQVGLACTARDRRPLGCRVYFCRSLPPETQQDLYERFHHEIADLHRKHGRQYDYRELSAALGEDTDLC